MSEARKSKAVSVYVAGPMQGYEDYNYPLFQAVSEALRGYGFQVVNPAELDSADPLPHELDGGEPWTVSPKSRAAYMKRDLTWVVGCDAICLLPGWEESKGANMELLVALMKGSEVWEVFEEDGEAVFAYSDVRPDLWKVMAHVEEVHS